MIQTCIDHLVAGVEARRVTVCLAVRSLVRRVAWIQLFEVLDKHKQPLFIRETIEKKTNTQTN